MIELLQAITYWAIAALLLRTAVAIDDHIDTHGYSIEGGHVLMILCAASSACFFILGVFLLL